jgi:phosphohistidine phosphatase
MQLYILRHGTAEDGKPGHDDSRRELTNSGRRDVRNVLQAARKAMAVPDVILSSPYVRAVQTAEVAAEVLEYRKDIVHSTNLVPDSELEAVWEEVRLHRDAESLMLVGHDPLFSSLVGYLLGAPEVSVNMKKGALARVDLGQFNARPRGVLKWLLTPKLVG